MCSLALTFLPLLGNGVAADPPSSCPSDINIDDSAWVLREIQAKAGASGGGYVYTMLKRIFAYQPDAAERFREMFSPVCFAETHSFVIDGRWQQIARRVVTPSGTRAFLLLPDNTWKEGSEIHVAADFKSPTDPAYYVLLFRASEVALHRKISLPRTSPSFRSER